MIYGADREDLRERALGLRRSLEEIAEEMQKAHDRHEMDPDATLQPTEELRRVRIGITQIEEQLEAERSQSPEVIATRNQLQYVGHLVRESGTDLDKEMLERLAVQFGRYVKAGDHQGVLYVWREVTGMKFALVRDKWWYWEANHSWLREPGTRFANKVEAEHWLAKADFARTSRNLPELRQAVQSLWGLQPPDEVEKAKDQATRSGLKRS